VEQSGGEPLSAERLRLIAAGRAGDLDALRRLLAEGADTGTLGFHFAEAVKSAIETGDTTWLKRTCKRAPRPVLTPHPHKVRARAFAESLGVIDLVSTQWGADERLMAWGFHVGKAEAAGGGAMAIGVSAATPTLVLVRSLPELAQVTAVAARILACAPSPQLYAGANLEVPNDVITPDDEGVVARLRARWKIRDPGRPFPEDALMAVPVRGPSFGMKIWRERVVRRVARLDRLVALQAPESILDDERRQIFVGLLELDQTGWTRELDPLPDHVTEVIVQVLDAFEEETEHGPSAEVLAERERGRRLATLFDEPPRLRAVPADGHLEDDEDDEDAELLFRRDPRST
jgi:hypothetical protein